MLCELAGSLGVCDEKARQHVVACSLQAHTQAPGAQDTLVELRHKAGPSGTCRAQAAGRGLLKLTRALWRRQTATGLAAPPQARCPCVPDGVCALADDSESSGRTVSMGPYSSPAGPSAPVFLLASVP